MVALLVVLLDGWPRGGWIDAVLVGITTGMSMQAEPRGELEQYVGHPLADDAALAEAALQIVRSGLASHVAITLGHLSALLVSAEGEMRLSVIEVEVRSAVGAGGSFLGAATYGLAAGQSIEEPFRLGLAAGTAAVMSPGTGLCQPADVER